MKELDAVSAIASIANADLREKHPMMGVFFEAWMVAYILRAYCEYVQRGDKSVSSKEAQAQNHAWRNS